LIETLFEKNANYVVRPKISSHSGTWQKNFQGEDNEKTKTEK